MFFFPTRALGKMTSSRNSRAQKSLFTGSDLMKKSVNGSRGAKQNHHPTRGKGARWKWQKASVFDSLQRWKSENRFSIFNISSLPFSLAMFPLIVFGFSGEMKVFFFYCCLMHQKLGGGRCNYRNAVCFHLIALMLYGFSSVQLKNASS